MSHHIYHTSGFIVAQKQKNEADILLKIFTPDFGMVLATAQGARKLESKTRFALKTYTFPEIDLIKTKENFRVGAVRPEPIVLESKQKILRAKVAAILARFAIFEESNEKLYEDIKYFLKKDLKNPDLVLMLIVLSNLGYWELTTTEKDFIETGLISSENKKVLLKKVNDVISHIHL